MMDNFIKIEPFDIPENTSKELVRLYDFIENTVSAEERKWAIAKIERIHALMFNPIMKIESVDKNGSK